ncbi:ATP-binding cassette domain-containing protein [Nocardioides marmoriginsengisoli]|uniref:ATP-binding cassette domain-containing protein n=1 Tax=Nocardioides marmoriginsengisoli TaxID=661483 RepID=A0A3N0CG62_9ACTN|nr:ATP-binding cassette domain-containing protein [Nocardioides marmoriginsengisoli]RNL62462.1 ATP-binding cassette domain-containing protein [Nocardioides marmoriginsengisoli]
MTEPVLELSGVTKDFAGVRAVDAVSCALAAGEVTGFIGPNGAGKSTMINLASGLLRPTQGSIRLRGANVTRTSMARRARLGIRRSFQHPHLLAGATVDSMLRLAASAPRSGGIRDRKAVADRFGLGDRLDQVVTDLPYGHQKLLNLAMLWVGRAVVVLLDEPYAGVGPEHRDAVTEAIRTMAGDGAAVALVEHNLEIVSSLAPTSVVLDLGAVIFTGATQDALRDERVLTAYLGSAEETA